MFNAMIDLSHHNHVPDWTVVKRAGIAAVVHKATEGATWRDPLYVERREAAREAGLLFGSYHYASGVDPLTQADHYLAQADPRVDELICLDLEESTAGRHMDLRDAEAFVAAVERATGRAPVLYGGRLLRELCAGVAASSLSRCPLWYARFADAPIGIPPLWPRWTFWQYTDGASDPEPRRVAGLGPVDRDMFNGTQAEFFAGWPF